MFKKLLVVVLALTFLVSLCSVALATKDPSEFKRGTHNIGGNPNAGRALWGGTLIHPPVAPAATPIVRYLPDPMPLNRPAATCGVQSQHGAAAYYFDGDSTAGAETGPMYYGAAVRWDAGTDECTLKSVRLAFYAAATVAPNTGGVTGYVWADDGSGLPGAVIASQNVPHASVAAYPTMTLIPFNVVINGGEYHTGFLPNNLGDEYALLLDDETAPMATSSLFWLGGWSGNGAIFAPDDLDWVIENETCCVGAPSTACATQEWHCTPVYRWAFTKTAERFTATGQCTLKTGSLLISSFGTGAFSSGINARVYADNAGLPGSVLATVFVPHANVLYSPTYTVVDFSSLNLVFTNEDYFVGFESVNPAEVYQGITDDGGTYSCADAGVLRGVAWDGTQWDYQYNLDEYPAGTFWDDNYMYEVYTCCAEAEPSNCDNLNYAGTPVYYWPEPDAYGDQFRNMRFTNAGYCSLKTINLAFDASGSVGAPGAQVNIWSSDGTFPTSVITSYLVNPVTDYFPTYTSINVAPANLILTGEYHVGYTTIQNAPTDVLAILSDDGSAGTGRSIEQYLSNWWLMANSWGIDVNFLINVDVCCLPPGTCPMFCDPTDQWPVFAHDFARSAQSKLTLGDLCGVVFAWAATNTGVDNFSSPVISNDLVLVGKDDRIQAVDLLTGALVWDTKLIPAYGSRIGASMRSQITIDGGAFYFGNGTQRGFVKGDLLTGNHIWSRSTFGGNSLGPATSVTYGGSIVRGNEVFFGNANGDIFSLDATTGLTNYTAVLMNTVPVRGAISGAPATDGTQLFFALGVAKGGLHSVNATGAAFVPNWYWESPFIGTLSELFACAPSVRCDNVFLHASFAFGLAGNGAGYRQDIDPATGLSKWANYFLAGQNTFGGAIATTGSAAYFHSLNNGFNSPDGTTRGVRAVSFANSTVWVNGGVNGGSRDNEVWAHASVTCDPYTVYGTYNSVTGEAALKIVDGNTGGLLINYNLNAGRSLGSAIASASTGDKYIVQATGAGYLIAFKVGGPRGRLNVPETLVQFAGTNNGESAPVQRTDADAVENTGCATLNVTATLDAGSPPASKRRITDINPNLEKAANVLANNLVEFTVEEMMSSRPSASTMKSTPVLITEDGEQIGEYKVLANVKPAKANSQALAQPTWVDWVSPFSAGATVNFALGAGGSQAFTFEFDRSGMDFLAPNYYYVLIDSDDPDSLLFGSPAAIIEYQIPYEYCAVDTGRMEFGATGGEWYSNRGEVGDGLVSFDFTLAGSDDYMYEGTMFFMTSMNDAAWNPFGSTVPQDFGFLYPFYVGPYANGDCGGCDLGVTLPVEYTTTNGASYANTVGDLCTFAMIDSLQGAGLWPNQTGPTIGLLINYREVGTYGADFGDFKLIVVDLTNRNAAPINGLYYGAFEDWDINTNTADLQSSGNPSKGYLYQASGPDARGFIGLPLNGSYWPDGSKTDPMYNGRINDNATEVYDGQILDSLFHWTNIIPEDGFYYSPDDGTSNDKSMTAAFGKIDLAGNASKSYGFAIYGFDGSADINGDTEALSKFINKYAGFARGDIDNNDLIDLRDLVRLSRYVAALGNGPVPFKHLGDVDNDGDVDSDDCTYLAAYYFTSGPAPKSAFKF